MISDTEKQNPNITGWNATVKIMGNKVYLSTKDSVAKKNTYLGNACLMANWEDTVSFSDGKAECPEQQIT